MNRENRWIKLADIMPWEEIEDVYSRQFVGVRGQVAKSARMAFAALYIQTEEGFTDEQTRQHIQENPYMQYFCGIESYTIESPFDTSMMTYFRKRISGEMIQEINERVFREEALEKADQRVEEVKAQEEATAEQSIQNERELGTNEEQKAQKTGEEVAADKSDSGVPEGADEEKSIENNEVPNRGTMILDATCCPADIHYPTDAGLLNHARELTETIVDKLYDSAKTQIEKKPRMYRQIAREKYLEYAKKRKHTTQDTRRCVQENLQYIRRNLKYIDQLIDMGADVKALGRQLYTKLFTIRTLYEQQLEMFQNNVHTIEHRIVSIEQPHVRPIVRGKAGVPVEFGAKVSIALVGGFAFLVYSGWENYSEGKVFQDAVERYRRIFGFYPKTILADRAYPSRENRLWCQKHGIRLSGPRLGRKTEEEKKEESLQIYQDGCERVAVEGEFGVCKRRYSLDRVMTRLPDTSMSSISMTFFVANMERKLRSVLAPCSSFVVLYDLLRHELYLCQLS